MKFDASGKVSEREMVVITHTDNSAAAYPNSIWKEIEISESYLVCCMYVEATTLASSLLERLCINDGDKIGVEEDEVSDILECIGMVLVQSLKELGRTSEILDQLKLYFTPVTTIPPQVLVTGACLQVAEGYSAGVQELLEEFLGGWRFFYGRYYSLDAVVDSDYKSRHALDIDNYFEVVEVYAVTLLVKILNQLDFAISWVEKASLPEEKRQGDGSPSIGDTMPLYITHEGLLRRLHSMHSVKVSCSLHSPTNDDDDVHYSFKESNIQESKAKHAFNDYGTKEPILRFSGRVEPYFCFFKTIRFKFGNTQFAISSGKILIGCLVVLSLYILKRKQAALKRFLSRQAISVKRALIDLWQLAFSYEVNPLAAVQPLSTATRGG